MIGSRYNHDPRHYSFVRQTHCFAPISEPSPPLRSWVIVVAVIIAVALVVMG